MRGRDGGSGGGGGSVDCGGDECGDGGSDGGSSDGGGDNGGGNVGCGADCGGDGSGDGVGGGGGADCGGGGGGGGMSPLNAALWLLKDNMAQVYEYVMTSFPCRFPSGSAGKRFQRSLSTLTPLPLESSPELRLPGCQDEEILRLTLEGLRERMAEK